jgi:uncharacterized Tic20 family protein
MPDNQAEAPPTIQPPPTQNPPNSPAPPPGSPGSDARMWNMLCHLSALAGFVIPFGSILGPLIIWQIKKNEFPSVDIHGKASVNFQITVMLALIVCLFPAFFCLGILVVPAVLFIGLAGLIFAIIAGIKANNGEDYKYPWSLELIK